VKSGADSFQTGRSVLVAGLLVMSLAFTGMVERIDLWWFDSLQAMGSSRASLPQDTALVLIDEQSLTTLGNAPFSMRWPWPRTAFAALLAVLQAAGAERIAVDLIFFESSAAAEQDLLLGAVAAGLPGVILATVTERLPVVWPESFRSSNSGLFDQRKKWGFVRSVADAGSVIRRYHPCGSLAEAAQLNSSSAECLSEAPVLLRWRGNLEQLRTRGVPMLSAAPFVVAGWEILGQAAQAHPDLDPAGLAAAITASSPPPGLTFDEVRGKTVFVGANAAATFDAVATPLGAPEPGVIVQWNAFANLRADDYIRPVWSPVVWILALVALVLLIWAGRESLSLIRPAITSMVFLVVVVASSAGLFLAGSWLPPGLIMAAVLIGFTVVAAESFRVERARKQEIQGWFGAYVSPAVVNRLLADPDAIELGGEQRELTIMFSDIAGFTTISERLQPAELVTLINRFLEGQTERIIDCGGYLDKYIGDAVMAVFGSPEPLENHALAACKAALACRVALGQLNDEIEEKYGLRLGMRTGINTGDVVVGNVGSTRKRNYTVLGDAVNLASRLEGANKQTGTSILLGPQTAVNVAGSMLLRPVARLQVKGKTQAAEVFELIADLEQTDSDTIEFATKFTRGFEAYCEGNFAAAAEIFTSAAVLRPGDELTATYLEESRTFTSNPPGPDWRAVLKLETK